MEENYIDEPEEEAKGIEENQEEHVEIYSKMAIRGFSIFFSSIFGGVLLFINLRRAGLKSAANTVLAFAIGYTLVASILFSMVGGNTSASLLFNLVGGIILADYFFPKYFPDNDYYPKPIWNALAVSILICTALVLIMYYTGNMPELGKALSKK
jgi:hypothetical protein